MDQKRDRAEDNGIGETRKMHMQMGVWGIMVAGPMAHKRDYPGE